jgi:hypothetical protein
LQAALAGPILGIDFLRKFRITVASETSLVLFACMATAPTAAKLLLTNISAIVEPLVPVTSTIKKIPDSIPDNVKRLPHNFSSILCTGDVMPTPIHGVEHHIHPGNHPLAKSRQMDPEKLEIAKAEF